MKNEHTDDTFLSRWLNNDLTSEELVSFKKTTEYKEYQKIIDATQNFKAPNFNEKEVFEKIHQKTNDKKVKKLIPNWMFAAAASIALLLSTVYYLTGTNETYSTSFGEQLALVLPDGSEVLLNSKSSVTYKKSDWFNGNRTLELNGEGYFKVKKGSTFSVLSENGKVRVLGTQFNVKTNPSYFEVLCYEGKVQVENKEELAILTKGLSFRKIENKSSEKGTFINEKPNWLDGETSFNNAPLKYVLEELEKQYNIKINSSNIDLNILYTGAFTNINLNLALQTICAPLSIQFTVDSNKVVLSKK
ncbi:MAG: FecR domain-containing protein [Flavobacteriaceae bacterium]|nr:FecR domain-containing protein [Flavobacteriaceae bacterium]